MTKYTATFKTHCENKEYSPKYQGTVVTRKSKRTFAAAWRVIGQYEDGTWTSISQGFTKDQHAADKASNTELNHCLKDGVKGRVYKIEIADLVAE